MLLLRPLAYKDHPYKWATIGKEISHIENAKLEDVEAFSIHTTARKIVFYLYREMWMFQRLNN